MAGRGGEMSEYDEETRERRKEIYMREMMNGTPLYAFRADEVKEILEYFPWLNEKKEEISDE